MLLSNKFIRSIFSVTLHNSLRPHINRVAVRSASTMTTGIFKHIDLSSHVVVSESFSKPWGKVDNGGESYKYKSVERAVKNIRGEEDKFGTDVSGFAVYQSPATEKTFDDDQRVRTQYYPEVEALLREKLPGIKKVHIFDHTIRRRIPNSPRVPVQQVHVDQTPGAAEVRVRRHLGDEAEELLKGRYQIINVWRPIENPATDYPLAVIDWRTMEPQDLVTVKLLYPKRQAGAETDDDDRGKEVAPRKDSLDVSDYEIKGETYGVAPNNGHQFYYVKDMRPDEAMFIKCFDSRSQNVGGVKGLAGMTPHTAFVDPDTPSDAPGRQSIEVRCLVFYE